MLPAIQFATELYRARSFFSANAAEARGVEPVLVNDALDGDGGCFTAADAECGDAAFQVLRFQRMQQRHDQAGSRRADRVSKRAGAAIDVEIVPDNAEIALRRHRHHREGLVDLEQIDIADAPADLVEQLADRRDRRGGEPLRLLAGWRGP